MGRKKGSEREGSLSLHKKATGTVWMVSSSVFFILLAFWLVRHQLRGFNYHEIKHAFHQIPESAIGFSLFSSAVSYLCLTAYGLVAFRYIGRSIELFKIIFASFIGYAFSNNSGSWGAFIGAGIRFRLYSAWGIPAADIAKVVGFSTLTFWTGFFALGGIVCTLYPIPLPMTMGLPVVTSRPVGIVLLGVLTAYVFTTLIWKRPVHIRGFEIPVLSPVLLMWQLVLSVTDWLASAYCLFSLLPSGYFLSFPSFLNLFLLAQLIGIISNVPGGLGVFEGAMVILLASRIPADYLLSSLVAYRIIYYFVPLVIAAFLLGFNEIIERNERFRKAAAFLAKITGSIVPDILAILTFLSGCVLLISGATPEIQARMARLGNLFPLSVIEISHFLASVIGSCLLVLAWGLRRRLDGAYYLTLALLVSGSVFSLLKGFDFEEAVFLMVVLAVLLPLRRHFYRRSSLFNEPLSAGWLASAAVAITASVWIGIFAFRHVEYAGDLWWHFALWADAPRFLRGTIGAVSVLLFFSLWHILHPARFKPAFPDRQELDLAWRIARRSVQTYAYLAVLGDKAFLFNKARNAFIMYAVTGRTWVSMGDPVGPRSERADLIWHFNDLCDEYDAVPVFYEIGPDDLTFYLDLGMYLVKIGEEARVPLADFSLGGASKKRLRNEHNRLLRDGCRFRIIPVTQVADILPRLRHISDTWLSRKHMREKGFSLGFFNERYLLRFPVGVVNIGREIIAFANIWEGAEREELSIDLMRYVPDAPHGIMDFLLVELMLWGAGHGFKEFNLGMAPLSGLKEHPSAPLWNKLGAMIYEHEEYFYNFQGLRHYKEKFSPVWIPKYIARPARASLAHVLRDVAGVISRGPKGIL